MIRSERAANPPVVRSRIVARCSYCAATKQLRLPCVIAAALASGCTVLYSEDMQHGQLIDGTLTIVNPFAA